MWGGGSWVSIIEKGSRGLVPWDGAFSCCCGIPFVPRTQQVVKQHKQIEKAIAELMAHPRLKKYGRPHKTSEPEHITDTESEFVVTYLKHTYADRVIFEFRVHNNMDDVLLENVSIHMDCEMEGLEEEGGIPIKDLASGESKSAYVTFAKDPDSFLTGSAACVLCFTMKEVDKDTGEPEEDGTEDEYQLEEVLPRTPPASLVLNPRH